MTALYYEYEEGGGWLIGTHNDAQRPHSTTIAPDGIPPNRARWNGTAWVEDQAREVADEADRQQKATALQQAVSICKAYDPATATAAEVRFTLGAALFILRRIVQELRG